MVKSLLKTMLLLCALMVGSGSVWAEEVTILSEDFSTNNNGTLLKEAGWTLSDKYSFPNFSTNNKGLQIASGSGAASAQTPVFSTLVGTSATLTFQHRSSSSSSSRTFTITGNNCKVNGQSSITLTAGTSAGSSTISITNASTSSSITFSAAKDQGTIIDDVTITYTKASNSPLYSITLSGTYPTTFTVGDKFSYSGMTVTATYEDNNTSDVTSKATFSGYDMSTVGTQTITVSYTEGTVTKSANYSIKVKGTADLEFSPNKVTVSTGSEKTITFSKSTDASVNFVVQDETVATYNPVTGNIQGLKEGTTTLTASSEATEYYNAGEATCTIKVLNPEWIDFTAQGYSNSDDVSSVTGLNGTVTLALGTNTNGNNPKWYDSGSAVRLYTGNTIKITAKSGYVLSYVEFNVTSGSMSATSFNETVTKGSNNDFTLSTPATEITYTTGSNFRIDQVKIVLATVTKTVTSAGWATYAPTFHVGFASEEAYIIEVADENETVLTEVSSVPAGTPVLLKGAGDHTMNVVASSTTDVSDNCLKVSDGTITKDDGVYVLANGDFGVGFYLWIGETPLSAGKIYMQPNMTTSRSFFSLTGEASGIDALLTKDEGVRGEVYNLSGQRVAQPSKGLYIINGKKVNIK